MGVVKVNFKNSPNKGAEIEKKIDMTRQTNRTNHFGRKVQSGWCDLFGVFRNTHVIQQQNRFIFTSSTISNLSSITNFFLFNPPPPFITTNPN